MAKLALVENDFTEQRGLREKYKDHSWVLDKVKTLIMIPEMEMMTLKMIAEYYDVGIKAIEKCYQRNKEEINEDGVIHKSLADIRDARFRHDVSSVQERTKATIIFPNFRLDVPNSGLKVFSKQAVFRFGLLLRDSRIAKEVRTEILKSFMQTLKGQNTESNGIELETVIKNGVDLIVREIKKMSDKNTAEIQEKLFQVQEKLSQAKEELSQSKEELSLTKGELSHSEDNVLQLGYKLSSLEGENAQLQDALFLLEKEYGYIEKDNKILSGQFIERNLDRMLFGRYVKKLSQDTGVLDRNLFSQIYCMVEKEFKTSLHTRKEAHNDGAGMENKLPLYAHMTDGEWEFAWTCFDVICQRYGTSSSKIMDKVLHRK